MGADCQGADEEKSQNTCPSRPGWQLPRVPSPASATPEIQCQSRLLFVDLKLYREPVVSQQGLVKLFSHLLFSEIPFQSFQFSEIERLENVEKHPKVFSQRILRLEMTLCRPRSMVSSKTFLSFEGGSNNRRSKKEAPVNHQIYHWPAIICYHFGSIRFSHKLIRTRLKI